MGIRIVKRERPPKWEKVFTPLLTISGTIPIIIILAMFAGASPSVAITSFFEGPFGSVGGFSEVLARATPFLLVGIGIAFAFKCRVWNIGGEGQLIIGAIIATWAAFNINLPAPLLILLIFLVCFILSGGWGAIAGGLKAKFGINEIVVTIMMNWIAIYILNYVVRGPLKDPAAPGLYPFSAAIPSFARLPTLIPGTRLHLGFIIALILAILAFYILFRTTLGYRIRTTGANPGAARYAGINVKKQIVFAMFLSGGIIGIAGGIEVIGLHHFLLDEISAGYGYTGILVGLLGGLNPLGIIPASIFFGILIVGIEALQRAVMMPFALVFAVFGFAMLFILIGEFFTRYRIRRT